MPTGGPAYIPPNPLPSPGGNGFNPLVAGPGNQGLGGLPNTGGQYTPPGTVQSPGNYGWLNNPQGANNDYGYQAPVQTPAQKAWSLFQSMLSGGLLGNPQGAADKAALASINAHSTLNDQILGNQRAGEYIKYSGDLAHLNAAQAGTASDRGYGVTLEDAAGKERDIQNAHFNNQFGYQNSMAHTEYDAKMQALYSDATARGAITTGGTRNTRDINNQGLVEQLQQNNDVFNTGKGMTGVQYEREYARGQHMVQQADAVASTYGTDRQNLLATLNNGLEGLNLGSKVTGLDLLEKTTSTSADSVAAANAVIDNIMRQAQTNPEGFLAQYGQYGQPAQQNGGTRQWGSGRRIG